MAFATGSGDYVALMAAVLSFAIADGWSTTGGTWPISKGVVRGVDWSTFTQAETDFTTGGGGSRTVRYIRIAVGTSGANATANAAANATSAVLPNMDRTFTNWWIFSDSGVGKPNYIHVVVKFSNGVSADCYGHFSFGEINKHGMTHTGVAYATAQCSRAYATATGSLTVGNESRDWNDPMYAKNVLAYSGRIGLGTGSNFNTPFNTLVYIIDPTVSPVPASGGWPLANTLNDSLSVLNVTSYGSGGTISLNTSTGRNIINSPSNNAAMKWSTFPMIALAQPYSGGLSLGNIPFIVTNGALASSNAMMLGSFPDVFTSSVESYAPEDEITFNSETYKVFPILRKTLFANVGQSNVISSGPGAFAYKKVA